VTDLATRQAYALLHPLNEAVGVLDRRYLHSRPHPSGYLLRAVLAVDR
jgi:hypothetical protein